MERGITPNHDAQFERHNRYRQYQSPISSRPRTTHRRPPQISLELLPATDTHRRIQPGAFRLWEFYMVAARVKGNQGRWEDGIGPLDLRWRHFNGARVASRDA